MSLSITLIVTVLAAFLGQRLWIALRGPLSHVPGPFHSRFATLVYAYHTVLGTTPKYSARLFAQYGPVVRVGPTWIIIGGRDAVNHVLVTADLPKSPLYEGASLKKHRSLISERNNIEYKKRRKVISQGFSAAYLSGLEPLFQDCVKDVVDLLDQECEAAKETGSTAVVDVYNLLSNVTSDVITSTSLGGSMHAVRSRNDQFKTLVMQYVRQAVIRVIVAPLRYMDFGPFARSTDMDDLVQAIMAKRRADKAANVPVKKDLLQLLLDAQKADPERFPDAQISEELVLFYLAGSDTSSTTAFMGLLKLLKNPESLARLQKELDSHTGSGGELSFEDLGNLSYLNAVIQEILRLCFVALGGLSRYTTDTIVIDGIAIPKDIVTIAYINQPAQNEALWTDALLFIPERWLPGYEGLEPDKKAFHPFSGGLRSCVGKDFALKELRLILAQLLCKFDFTMIPGEPEEMTFHVVPYLKGKRHLMQVRQRG